LRDPFFPYIGDKALGLAAHKGHDSAVKFLLEAGAYTVRSSLELSGAKSALHKASQARHDEVLRVLLRFGVGVNDLDGSTSRNTVLHRASGKAVVGVLIAAGAQTSKLGMRTAGSLHVSIF